MRKSVKLFLLLIVFALLSAGCGVSREKLAEKGIYTEIYSPELLAKRIETAQIIFSLFIISQNIPKIRKFYSYIRHFIISQDNICFTSFIFSNFRLLYDNTRIIPGNENFRELMSYCTSTTRIVSSVYDDWLITTSAMTATSDGCNPPSGEDTATEIPSPVMYATQSAYPFAIIRLSIWASLSAV